jgi:hypothetical protein
MPCACDPVGDGCAEPTGNCGDNRYPGINDTAVEFDECLTAACKSIGAEDGYFWYADLKIADAWSALIE